MNDERRDGRAALVLGASRDIGAATARELSANGFRVAAVGRNRAALERLVEAEATGIIAIVADLADEGAVERAFAEAELRLGPTAVLVNNASLDHRAPSRSFRSRAGTRSSR